MLVRRCTMPFPEKFPDTGNGLLLQCLCCLISWLAAKGRPAAFPIRLSGYAPRRTASRPCGVHPGRCAVPALRTARPRVVVGLRRPDGAMACTPHPDRKHVVETTRCVECTQAFTTHRPCAVTPLHPVASVRSRTPSTAQRSGRSKPVSSWRPRRVFRLGWRRCHSLA